MRCADAYLLRVAAVYIQWITNYYEEFSYCVYESRSTIYLQYHAPMLGTHASVILALPNQATKTSLHAHMYDLASVIVILFSEEKKLLSLGSKFAN